MTKLETIISRFFYVVPGKNRRLRENYNYLCVLVISWTLLFLY